MALTIKLGEQRKYDKFLRHLTDIQYERNDYAMERGTFRVKGDVIDVVPAGEEVAYRIEFFGDEVESLKVCLLYTSRAHETVLDLVCRLLLEKKNT